LWRTSRVIDSIDMNSDTLIVGLAGNMSAVERCVRLIAAEQPEAIVSFLLHGHDPEANAIRLGRTRGCGQIISIAIPGVGAVNGAGPLIEHLVRSRLLYQATDLFTSLGVTADLASECLERMSRGASVLLSQSADLRSLTTILEIFEKAGIAVHCKVSDPPAPGQ
jgi:hypothetical protein